MSIDAMDPRRVEVCDKWSDAIYEMCDRAGRAHDDGALTDMEFMLTVEHLSAIGLVWWEDATGCDICDRTWSDEVVRGALGLPQVVIYDQDGVVDFRCCWLCRLASEEVPA